MKFSRPNINLNTEETEIVKSALNLIITEDIEGITPNNKIRNDSLAKKALTKLKNHEANFDSEDLDIIHFSLMYLRLVINETLDSTSNNDIKFISDSKNYLSISNRLIQKLEFIFIAHR